MRFLRSGDAREAQERVHTTGFMGYFAFLTFIIGFTLISCWWGRIQPIKMPRSALIGGNNMAAVHLANAVGGNLFLGFISAKMAVYLSSEVSPAKV